jgi:cytochrome c5
MKRLDRWAARLAALSLAAPALLSGALETSTSIAAEKETLRAVESFTEITDPARRSAALFTEAGKVLLHPRCVNCHPASDRPLQGEAGRPHEPRVQRGPDGHGVPAMRCSTCHTSSNYDVVGMPGNAHWALAPASMAWEGRSLGQICEQIKDQARNGGRQLSAVVEHMTTDSLVGWAWVPGPGREPAPGTQATFGALIDAWARSGAACPSP